jgi:hypothetical protein
LPPPPPPLVGPAGGGSWRVCVWGGERVLEGLLSSIGSGLLPSIAGEGIEHRAPSAHRAPLAVGARARLGIRSGVALLHRASCDERVLPTGEDPLRERVSPSRTSWKKR